MKKPKFHYTLPDDERVEFFVNGIEVASANHDDHGWSGMRSMQEMFEAIALNLGIAVTEKTHIEEVA